MNVTRIIAVLLNVSHDFDGKPLHLRRLDQPKRSSPRFLKCPAINQDLQLSAWQDKDPYLHMRLPSAKALDVFGFFLYPLPGTERQQVAGNGFLLRPAGGY